MPQTKTFTWRPNQSGWYQPGYSGENGARLYFWNTYQVYILPELQKDLNNGWKPITEVGPAALRLHRYQHTEHAIGLTDVVLWFVTLGLFFVFDLLQGFGRYKVTRYELVEFRVELQK